MSPSFRKINGFNDSDKFVVIGNKIYIKDDGKSYKSKLINGLPLDYVLSIEFEGSEGSYQYQDLEFEEELEEIKKPTNVLNPHVYQDLELDKNVLKTINLLEYPLISNSHLKSKTNYTKNKQSNSKGQKKVKSQNLEQKHRRDKKNKATLLKDGNSYKTNVRKDNETEYYTSINDHFDDLSDCYDDLSDYLDDDISHIAYNYNPNNITFSSWAAWEDYITSNEYVEIHSDRQSNGIRVIEFGTRSQEEP